MKIRTMARCLGLAALAWAGCFCVAAGAADVSVTNVTAKQRYPWNGLVDIDYELSCSDAMAEVVLSVSAVDTTSGAAIPVRTVRLEGGEIGDGLILKAGDLPDGKGRLVWDAGTDAPGRLSGVKVEVKAAVDDALYMVLDLSAGNGDGATYPVSFTNAAPEGGWGDEYKTTKLALRRIPAGTFTMGSPSDELGRWDNETQRDVTLTQPFHIGVFEVTQKQWELVQGSNGSSWQGEKRPVESMTFGDIRGWDAGARWPVDDEVDADSFMGHLRARASSYRWDLPTEAQWEFACRAGTVTAVHNGKNLENTEEDSAMGEVARYGYNRYDGKGGYNEHTTVGSYLPNAWGLYDMQGNAWEYALDWWDGGNYSPAPVQDPPGPDSGWARTIRGGSWCEGAYYDRVAVHTAFDPANTAHNLGLRLACRGGVATEPDVASAESAAFRLDTRTGIRVTHGTEELEVSGRWKGASVEVRADGELIATADAGEEKTVEWTLTGIGTHTVQHTSGGVTLEASFTVPLASGGWQYVLDEDTGTATLTGYTGTFENGSVTIPATVGWGADEATVTALGAGLFANRADLTEVRIATALSGAPASAFLGCEYFVRLRYGAATVPGGFLIGLGTLRELVLEEGVERIGMAAFSETGITNLTCPSSLRTIDSSAFGRCADLAEISFNDGLQTIGYTVFSDCTALGSVEIPESVTSFGSSSFSGCTGLTNVVFGGHIDSLCSVFGGCTNLERLVIGGGVKKVACGTFSFGMPKLKELVLGEGLETVTDGSFEYLGIENLVLPDSLDVVQNAAFSGCTNLTNVVFGAGIGTLAYSAFGGDTALTELTIPASVTNLSYPFGGCTGLTNLTVNATVEVLSGFSGLTNLQRLVIGGGVKKLDSGAFTGLTDIRELVFGEGIEIFSSGTLNNLGIENLVLPDSLRSIEYGALRGCTNLTNIVWGAGIETVAYSAFADCTALEEVTIPATVTNLGWAFTGCTALTDLVIPATVEMLDGAFKDCTGLTNVAVNATVDVISGAFSGCTGLESVEFGANVRGLDGGAFSNCTALASVEIPGSVKTLGEGVFDECTGLKTIQLNEGIESIGFAFRWCTALESVEIPDSVTTLSSGAFSGCTGITNLVIGDGITDLCGKLPNIGTALERLVIGGGVKEIGCGMFYGLTNLTELVFSEGLEVIYQGTFNGAGISELRLPNSLTRIEGGSLCSLANLTTIVWGTGIRDITGGILMNCTALTELTIPASVTNLSGGLFNNCTALTNVTVNANIEKYEGLLYGCTNLERVVLGDGVGAVGDNAFAGFGKLSEVVLGANVASIGEGAFSNCTALASVTIPDSVESVGANAFAGCTSLEELSVPESWYGTDMLEGAGVPEGGVVTYQGIEPLEITTTALPGATEDLPYEAVLEVSGGVGPYSWHGVEGGYSEATAANSFAETGEAKGWQGDDNCWELELPFAFPYFGNRFTRAKINSNGAISFGSSNFTIGYYDEETFMGTPVIAVLWADLTTDNGDVYVESGEDAVTVRWSGKYWGGGATDFSATLHSDGIIVLSYGAGNAQGGTIGISAGDGKTALFSALSGGTGMENAGDVVFALPQGRLPLGLTLTADGVLRGAPEKSGVHSFRAMVTDAAGVTAAKDLTLSVSGERWLVRSVADGGGRVEPERAGATNGMELAFTAIGGGREFLGWLADGEDAGTDPTWRWTAPEGRGEIVLTAMFGPMSFLVDAATGDDRNDGSEGAPFKTLQAAIDAAIDGDTIVAAPGDYAPISTGNKAIRIVAEAGAATTAIDASGTTNRCATLADSEQPYYDYVDAGTVCLQTNTVLEGFTLCGADTEEYNGGGVFGGTLVDCVVTGNQGPGYGGGQAYGNAFGCRFEGNHARYNGGGMAYGVAEDCVFEQNTAGDGGGYGGAGYGLLRVERCEARENEACYGGAFNYCPDIRDSVIENNRATGYCAYGGGCYGSGLTGCQVNDNLAEGESMAEGGALAGYGGATNCTIARNRAFSPREQGYAYGGGTYNVDLADCQVLDNVAESGWVYGGGVYGGNAVRCEISGNRVESSQAAAGWNAGYGGGASGSTLEDCIVSNNFAQYGGGLSGGTADRCLVIGNEAALRGGGLDGGTVRNCIVARNHAPSGGGGGFEGEHNTFVLNRSDFPSETYSEGDNNLFWGETPEGTVPGVMVDPWGGDYRLLAGCAAIDAGVATALETDFAGNPRTQGEAPDLGALEAEGGTGVPLAQILVKTEGSGRTDITHANVAPGESVTATAPDCGRPFLGWKADGEIVSTERTYTLENVTAHATLTAVFGPGDIWVDAKNGNDANDGSEAAPLKTLQAAVDFACDGDTVRAKPGVYGRFSVTGKSIAIVGEAGAEETVIDARWQGRCAALGQENAGADAPSARLSGFTLRRGRSGAEPASRYQGAACLMGRLEDCVIEDCGILESSFNDQCVFCNVELVHCIVRGCQAEHLFRVSDWENPVGTNRDTLVTGNRVTCLWAVSFNERRWENRNLTLAGNDVIMHAHANGYSVSEARFVDGNLSGSIWRNCIWWGNGVTAGGSALPDTWEWCCVEGAEPRGATEETGPVWSDNPEFVDPAYGDFRLSSASLYVDAGSDEWAGGETDLAGNARIAGPAVDLGCYEGGVVTCEITFELGEGLLQLDDRPLAVRIEKGTDAPAPEVAAVSGWRFDGWNPGCENITEDTTIVGKTTAVPSDWTVTFHQGRIEADETWGAETVHVVLGTVTVASDVTLTIARGAVVKFMPGAKLLREDGGMIVSLGATFTHLFDDDAGGDTLEDGAARVPVAGEYEVELDVVGPGTEYRYGGNYGGISAETTPLEEASAENPREIIWWPGNVHVLNDGYTVKSGYTLRLMPGCIVKVGDGKSLTVAYGGTLIAEGTLAKPVVITSIHDDEHGGDTDGDGGMRLPSGGDWHEIQISGRAELSHTKCMYGAPSNERGILAVYDGGTLCMDGCLVAYAKYDGVWNWGGKVAATNTVFMDLGWASAPYRGTQNEYVNCVFYGNDVGMCCWPNWWGNAVYKNCVFSECAHGWCELGGNTYGAPPSKIQLFNCLFFNPAGFGTQTCSRVGSNGNIWGDPKFADAEGGDFHVAEGSACIDAGDGAGAPEMDAFGNSRVTLKGEATTGTAGADGAVPDIGVHEYSGRYSAGSDVDVEPTDIRLLTGGGGIVQSGDTLGVSWRLASVGEAAAAGMWTDRVKLADGAGCEVLLGEQVNIGRIEPGTSKLYSGAFTIPVLMDGEWRFGVEANIDRGVLEGANTGNNVFISTNTVTVSNPAVAADGGTFVARRGETLVRVEGVPAAGAVLTVAGEGAEAWEVLGAEGRVPTAGLTWASLAGEGMVRLVVPSGVSTGAVYVLVQNAGPSQMATLGLEALETRLATVAPTVLPQANPAVLSVTGTGLGSMAGAELRSEETCVAAAREVLGTSETAMACVFDLAEVPKGAYRLWVHAGEAWVEWGEDVNVTRAVRGAQLEAWLELPNALRDGRVTVGHVCYRNTGDCDMVAPLFLVKGKEETTKISAAKTGPFTQNEAYVVGAGPTAPKKLLRAGAEGWVPFYFTMQGSCRIELQHLLPGGAVNADAYVGAWWDREERREAEARQQAEVQARLEALLPEVLDAFAERFGKVVETVPSWTIAGRAEFEDGTVAANETVGLGYRTGGSLMQTQTTDESGAFTFTGLVASTNYVISGVTVGVSDGGAVTVDGSDVTDVVLTVTRKGVVRGTVTVEEGLEAPEEGLTVYAEDVNGHIVSTTADLDGSYEFRGLPFGMVRVTTEATGGLAAGYAEAEVDEENWQAEVNLVLGGGVDWTGTLVDADKGTGVAGLQLMLTTTGGDKWVGQAATDEEGVFQFVGVPTGRTVRASVTTWGWVLAEESQAAVEVGSEALERDLQVRKDVPFYAFPAEGPAPLRVGFFLQDKEAANEVAGFAWDLDGDGETDSTEAEPRWDYEAAGTNAVTLTVTYADGTTRTFTVEACVKVHEKTPTVYQEGVLVLLDDDEAKSPDYDVEGWDEATATLTLNQVADSPALTPAVGTVVVFYDQDGCFAWKKVTAASRNGNIWTLTVENVTSFSEVYESFEYFASSMDRPAPAQTSSRRAGRRDGGEGGENEYHDEEGTGSINGSKTANWEGDGGERLSANISVSGNYSVHIHVLEALENQNLGDLIEFRWEPDCQFKVSGNFAKKAKIALVEKDEVLAREEFKVWKIKAGVLVGYHINASGELSVSGSFTVDGQAGKPVSGKLKAHGGAELSAYLYLKAWGALGDAGISGEAKLGFDAHIRIDYNGGSLTTDFEIPKGPVTLKFNYWGSVSAAVNKEVRAIRKKLATEVMKFAVDAQSALTDAMVNDICGGKLSLHEYVQKAAQLKKTLDATSEKLEEVEEALNNPDDLMDGFLQQTAQELGMDVAANGALEEVRAQLNMAKANLQKYKGRLLSSVMAREDELKELLELSATVPQEKLDALFDLSTLKTARARVKSAKEVVNGQKGKAEGEAQSASIAASTYVQSELGKLSSQATGQEAGDVEALLASIQGMKSKSTKRGSKARGTARSGSGGGTTSGGYELVDNTGTVTVDYGDGQTGSVGADGKVEHKYAEAGHYLVTIENDAPFSVANEGLLVQVQDLDVANRDFPTAALIEAKANGLLPGDYNPLSGSVWSPKSKDGLSYGEKLVLGLPPTGWDASGDGMEDKWKMQKGLDPSSGNGRDGADGDPDGDGATNYEEYKGEGMGQEEVEPETQKRADGQSDYDPPSDKATDPMSPDTDEGGMPDGTELKYGLNPLDGSDDEGLCWTCAVEGEEYHGCTCLRKFGTSYPVRLVNGKYHCECGGCPDCQPVDDEEEDDSKRSYDPNEIIGPLGFGDPETERYVGPGTEMEYTIFFENKADAAAAAQEVRVTLQLDASLDWGTFEAGSVMANNTLDEGLAGSMCGTSQVTMATTAYDFRTTVGVDTNTGVVEWYLRVVDTNAFDGWPEDPYAGFLPPNTTNYCGEGYVTFKVRAREDVPDGTRIEEQASIVFDYNEPIVTEPGWWNVVARQVTVAFGEDGALGAQDYVLGTAFGELPEAGELENHVFGGWWTGQEGEGNQVTAETVVGDGMSHLYPRWVLQGSRVVFDGNGGTPGTESVVAGYGRPMPTAEGATRKNYTFLGYFDAEEGGVQYYDGKMASVTNWDRLSAEVTLYAHWRGNPSVITINPNGGKAGTKKVKAYYGEKVPAVAKAPTRTGYILLGIYSAKKGGTAFWNGDMKPLRNWTGTKAAYTFYARWKKSTTTVVRFDANGGRVGTRSVTATYGAPMPAAKAPTRTGFVFQGYYTKKSGGTQFYTAKMASARKWSGKKRSQTLYAHWKRRTSKVTIDWHGGLPAKTTVTATYGSALPKLSLSTRKGYDLVGVYTKTSGGTKYWNGNGTGARKWTATGAAYTFHARWKLKQAVITLDPAGGAGGTASVTATYGRAMPAAQAPTRKGYRFLGYFTSATGGTQYYTAKMASARNWNGTGKKYTFHAQWEKVATITLNAAGGSNGTAKVTATVGKPMPAATAPERAGYAFLGYFTAATGGTQYYTATMGSARNWNGSGNSYTFHAQWARQAVITLDANGGSNGTVQVTAVAGRAMPAAVAPVRAGYEFLGIFDQKAGGTQYYTATMDSARDWNGSGTVCTFHAQWVLAGLEPEAGVVAFNGPVVDGTGDLDVGWAAVDGDEETAWQGAGDGGEWNLALTFEVPREVGGVELVEGDTTSEDVALTLSEDGETFQVWDGISAATIRQLLLTFTDTNGVPPSLQEVLLLPPQD
ncbi:MAG: leucine-rich repeat protein [Kiritimatiellae bacterium]|nr:leucine-rich repeat protein [Kiritimatiellia bacterium]